MLFLLVFLFVGVAVVLAWFLIAHDRGQKEPVGMLWLAAGLGLIGAFVASYFEKLLIPASHLTPLVSSRTLLSATLLVGVIEETCKFLPLALLVYPKRYFNEHTDGVIYFALAGLGFGLPENILYTLQFGAKAGIGRVILTPFFHAAITAFVGYYLIKCKLNKKPVWWVILPLIAAVLVHGVYDFGLSGGKPALIMVSVFIGLCLSTLLFVLFVRASDYDQDHGLSVVGRNAFCRSCGLANPHHYLYCTNCGKNA